MKTRFSEIIRPQYLAAGLRRGTSRVVKTVFRLQRLGGFGPAANFWSSFLISRHVTSEEDWSRLFLRLASKQSTGVEVPHSQFNSGLRLDRRGKLGGRVRLTNSARWFFNQMYRWCPSILQVLAIPPRQLDWTQDCSEADYPVR
jgi:hypothetical protein